MLRNSSDLGVIIVTLIICATIYSVLPEFTKMKSDCQQIKQQLRPDLMRKPD